MALGNISQLFKDTEDKLKVQPFQLPDITTPPNLMDAQLEPEPIAQPAEKSDIAQLFKTAEDKVYQKEIGPDTLSSSKFEFDDVKEKATLADLDQTIPSIVKGVKYGTTSLPQSIGGLIKNWADVTYVKANPSAFVGDTKWEGADEKIFEAMHTSRYAPVRGQKLKWLSLLIKRHKK